MIFWVDTFTDRACSGNPTAVILPTTDLSQERMQLLATELNLPVTAFLYRRSSANAYDIRYFTSITEIPACGHATLAASAVLAGMGNGSNSFHTIQSRIIEAIHKEGVSWLQYPIFNLIEYVPEPALLQSLNLKEYVYSGVCEELEALFLEVGDPRVLRAMEPDFQQLVQSNGHIKEVVITSMSDDSGYDFLLRSFCPWVGIDEDPVTGSVHSVLAGYWKSRLGKDQLKAWQASARGGEVFVKNESDSVYLGGRSVVLFSGELLNVPMH